MSGNQGSNNQNRRPKLLKDDPDNQKWFNMGAALLNDPQQGGEFLRTVINLLNSIENTIKTAHQDQTFGQSAKYANVEQTSVPGRHRRMYVAHASSIWLNKMIQYRPRVNNFDFKRSGNRDVIQVNFVRLIEPNSKWLANAHITIEP